MNWKFWKSKKIINLTRNLNTFKFRTDNWYTVQLIGGLVTTDMRIINCEISANETKFETLIGGKIKRWFTFEEFLSNYHVIFWGEIKNERKNEDNNWK